MAEKDPYDVIKHQHITEKTTTLLSLQNSTSNKCISKFEYPKYVFVVDKNANKHDIARALEHIYREQSIKVLSVNTVNVKPKKRRIRGRLGKRPGFKKAIVTLEKGDSLDNL